MSLGPLPATNQLTDGKGVMTSLFQAWFGSIQQWLGPQGQFGTTAKRPTTNLYIGLQYFDTTLGYPVFIKSLGPTVWVNGAGGVV
jgi:hypothetical protein